jgi:hypothetical protein
MQSGRGLGCEVDKCLISHVQCVGAPMEVPLAFQSFKDTVVSLIELYEAGHGTRWPSLHRG